MQAKEVCVGGEFGIETRTYEYRRLINGKWSYIERTGIFVRQGIACEFTKEQAKIYEDLLNALRANVAKSPYLRFSDRNNTPQVAYKSSTPLGSNANAKYSSSAHEEAIESIQVADSLPVVKDGSYSLAQTLA